MTASKVLVVYVVAVLCFDGGNLAAEVGIDPDEEIAVLTGRLIETESWSEYRETSNRLSAEELGVFEDVRKALDRYPGELELDEEMGAALAVTPGSEVGLLPDVNETPLQWIHLPIEHPLFIPSYPSMPLKEGPIGGDPFAFEDEKSGAMIIVFTEYSSAFESADWIPSELHHPGVEMAVHSLSETLEKSQFEFIMRVFSSTPQRLEISESLPERIENLILLRLKAALLRSVRPDTLKVFQGGDRRVLLAEPTEMTVTEGERTKVAWVVVEVDGHPNAILISGGFQATPNLEELVRSLLVIAANVKTTSLETNTTAEEEMVEHLAAEKPNVGSFVTVEGAFRMFPEGTGTAYLRYDEGLTLEAALARIGEFNPLGNGVEVVRDGVVVLHVRYRDFRDGNWSGEFMIRPNDTLRSPTSLD